MVKTVIMKIFFLLKWLVNLSISFSAWFYFGSSATNRLITSKDYASVQLNIGHLDADGIYTGQFTTLALCGFVRAQVCQGVKDHA